MQTDPNGALPQNDTPPQAEALSVRRADLADAADAATVVALLDAYARDPFGDNRPLADDVRERLIPALRAHPTTLHWIASLGDRPVGLVTAFVGFSTFYAKPLVNLHDVAVLPEARGRGVGRAMLRAVEAHAREIGCCRLTLEVESNNQRAKALYESEGYGPAPDGETPWFYFYKKPLD